MKRTVLILALVFALALPSAAMAAAEFSLGGFIKLDTFWDSTQEGKNMNTAVVRNNALLGHHGRLKFTAQGSRFNFTIKGPKLWGATTTGFIEIDFDNQADTQFFGTTAAGVPIGLNSRGASQGYIPRLRHAMFRLNWPGTELMFGQYWSMLCEWWPELAQDGPYQFTGIPTARLAQIRVTQKFAGNWTVAALIGEPNPTAGSETYSAQNDRLIEGSETPQVQAKIQYQADLWGKAAYYSKPTPFTVQIVGGWQRSVYQDAVRGVLLQGQDAFSALAGRTRHQYVDPWIIMGTAFIPVIPTHSANLAGTMSLMTQWYIGQGLGAFGFTNTASEVFRFAGVNGLGVTIFDVDLQERFGGYLQAQYYFTNQWYLTGAWSMSKAIGVGYNDQDPFAVNAVTNPLGYANGFIADQVDTRHEFNLCLWYRPISAIKFGLQYSYVRNTYFQNTAVGSTVTNLGDAHRVEFVGLFYF